MRSSRFIIIVSIIAFLLLAVSYLYFNNYIIKQRINNNNLKHIISSELIVRSYIEDYLLSTQYLYGKHADTIFKTTKEDIQNKTSTTLRQTLKTFYKKLKRTNRSLTDIHLHLSYLDKPLSIMDKNHKDKDYQLYEHSKKLKTINDTVTNYYLEHHTFVFAIAKPFFTEEDKFLATVEFTFDMEYFINIIKNKFNYDLALIDTKSHTIYGSTAHYFNELLQSSMKNHKIYKLKNRYKSLFFIDLSNSEKLAILFDVSKNIKERKNFIKEIDYSSIIFLLIGLILWTIATSIIIKLLAKQQDFIEILDKKVEEKTQYIQDLLKIFDKNVICSRTDLKGKITYASEAYCKISGYTQKELIGKSHNIARNPDMPKSLFKDMWNTIKQEREWIGEVKNLTKKGDSYWLKATIEPYYENGKHVGYSSIREDIRAKKQLEEMNEILEQKVKERTKEIENRLLIDDLTKLGSYYALSQDIDKCENSVFPVLMIINIDNFQNINNLYGYQTGNDVLKQFASCLESAIKDDKYKAYRLFADEFVVFQNCQYSDIDDYYQDLLYFKNTLTSHKFYIEPIDEYLQLDVTAGVSIGQENPIGTVDMALRYAKKHKLSFQTYHSDLNEESSLKNTILWKQKIKEAIQNNKVIPVFQPIVNRDQEIIKYEVLLRILSDDDQLIPPQEFLEEAINAKQYNELMKILIDKTLHKVKQSDKLFSLNLSYNDIFNNTLIHFLEEKFTQDKQLASQIVIEILETDEIQDSMLMKKFIQKFKEYGVRIAIDDFGTGHSNLLHILEIDPDYLKIDGAFIKDIDTDPKSYALVSSTVTFCKELDIKVIAEYVHSKEIFNILHKLGVDEFQGYYFSPPKQDI
jgi:c-di-GMP phosphodiesterase